MARPVTGVEDGEDGMPSAKDLVSSCREQVRRVSHELMPPEFSYADVGMVLADYVERVGGASGCSVSFASVPGDADWTGVPDGVALEMYRITQEAVANAVKHSGASHVDVTLSRDGDAITLAITDDGEPGKTRGGGIGRRTMRQRAEAVGGSLAVERKDGKTVVQFIIHNS